MAIFCIRHLSYYQTQYLFYSTWSAVNNNSTKLGECLGCDNVMVITFRRDSDSNSESKFSQYVLVVLGDQNHWDLKN